MPSNNSATATVCAASAGHVRVGLCPHCHLGRAERFEIEPACDDDLRANVVQEGARARVDTVREVDGAGHAEHLRGARSCEARIAPRRTYDAQRWPVCRERALNKARNATVLERVRRLEVLESQLLCLKMQVDVATACAHLEFEVDGVFVPPEARGEVAGENEWGFRPKMGSALFDRHGLWKEWSATTNTFCVPCVEYRR